MVGGDGVKSEIYTGVVGASIWWRSGPYGGAARNLIEFNLFVYSSDFQPVFRGKLVFRERSSGVPQEIW